MNCFWEFVFCRVDERNIKLTSSIFFVTLSIIHDRNNLEIALMLFAGKL